MVNPTKGDTKILTRRYLCFVCTSLIVGAKYLPSVLGINSRITLGVHMY